jgi:DNA-binding transcriptional regulator YiaG
MKGKDLKKQRETLKLSQEKLARLLNVSVSTVARWERLKEKELPSSTIIELAFKGLNNVKSISNN